MPTISISALVRKYVDQWNAAYPATPMWALVTPMKAGIHFRFNGFFIVVNSDMTPESIVRTFFHEYGHAEYEQVHGSGDLIESEMAAIRSSLRLCEAEGLEALAYQEAEAIKSIAQNEEPYKSAVAGLSDDSLWQKYALQILKTGLKLTDK